MVKPTISSRQKRHELLNDNMRLITTHNPKTLIIKLNKIEQLRTVVVARQARSEVRRDSTKGRIGLGGSTASRIGGEEVFR